MYANVKVCLHFTYIVTMLNLFKSKIDVEIPNNK